MLEHPKQFSKKFISDLFKRESSELNSFKFIPVGSGQVGDCFRIILDWKQEKDSPSSLIANVPQKINPVEIRQEIFICMR